ncbi:MaoC/PaaZ C-terminal domain-containing protein [Bordetella sp. BOR01]|uniref:MaoC family dehydratase n=1 Tax=Bordetella sp. BOR01 TaxID=2854779 RepID=UPI001C443733|nr:MaoC/PaaZ C-terminal domain-containing protein [Bordetella sp. BOR01]MBV7486676.1 MaoC family dehydratase N-terminal domain-containing protein [Bordetella sp. BOR01]
MAKRNRRIYPAAPFLDDLRVGDVHISYARTVTEAHVVGFAAFAGMQMPLFIDHDHARRVGSFGSPIAPGFLTASLSGGMLESVLGTNVLAGLGMDTFVFKVPVRPGDTLHAEVHIQDKRPTRDPGRGVLTLGIEVVNQRAEIVLSYQAKVLMKQHEPEHKQGKLSHD